MVSPTAAKGCFMAPDCGTATAGASCFGIRLQRKHRECIGWPAVDRRLQIVKKRISGRLVGSQVDLAAGRDFGFDLWFSNRNIHDGRQFDYCAGRFFEFHRWFSHWNIQDGRQFGFASRRDFRFERRVSERVIVAIRFPFSGPDADLFSNLVQHMNKLRHHRGSCSCFEIQLQRKHREFIKWPAVDRRLQIVKKWIPGRHDGRQFAFAAGRGFGFDRRFSDRNIRDGRQIDFAAGRGFSSNAGSTTGTSRKFRSIASDCPAQRRIRSRISSGNSVNRKPPVFPVLIFPGQLADGCYPFG